MKTTTNQQQNENAYISPDLDIVEIEFEQNILAGSGGLDDLGYDPIDY